MFIFLLLLDFSYCYYYLQFLVTAVSLQSSISSWNTHTFNGHFSGTTQVSRYQKSKTKSAPCSRQITMPAPHHSVFYRLDALPATQPTASKQWRYDISTSFCNVPVYGIYVYMSLCCFQWLPLTVKHILLDCASLWDICETMSTLRSVTHHLTMFRIILLSLLSKKSFLSLAVMFANLFLY